MMNIKLDAIRELESLLIERATGRDSSDSRYRELRLTLLQDASIKCLLPEFVQKYDALEKFWAFIKHKCKTYQERRVLIWDGFSKVVTYLEEQLIFAQPLDQCVIDSFKNFESDEINRIWQKALERRNQDPEAAITISRTLLESVCKHILDEAGISHDDKDDLPKLYKKTATQLNMAPEQHQEEIFKQILGGCQNVVQGLGTLRNKLSDAHGKGRIAAKPSARHAELSVNLAGSMASFLIATWQEKVEKERVSLEQEPEF